MKCGLWSFIRPSTVSVGAACCNYQSESAIWRSSQRTESAQMRPAIKLSPFYAIYSRKKNRVQDRARNLIKKYLGGVNMWPTNCTKRSKQFALLRAYKPKRLYRDHCKDSYFVLPQVIHALGSSLFRIHSLSYLRLSLCFTKACKLLVSVIPVG
jgi:hypothetical protein